MPTYLIKDRQAGTAQLIEAPNRAVALRHAAETNYEVTTPSAADAARLAMTGVLLEVAETATRVKAEQ